MIATEPPPPQKRDGHYCSSLFLVRGRFRPLISTSMISKFPSAASFCCMQSLSLRDGTAGGSADRVH